MTIRDFRHMATGQWGVWFYLVLMGSQEYIPNLIIWSIVIIALIGYEAWRNNADKEKAKLEHIKRVLNDYSIAVTGKPYDTGE